MEELQRTIGYVEDELKKPLSERERELRLQELVALRQKEVELLRLQNAQGVFVNILLLHDVFACRPLPVALSLRPQPILSTVCTSIGHASLHLQQFNPHVGISSSAA